MIDKDCSPPLLSIVIPSKGESPALLARLLDSLNKQSLEKSCWNIVVICNGGELPAETLTHLPANGQVLYLNEANVSKARNLGFKNSTGSVVFFVDDDCELSDSKTLSFLLSLFSSDAELCAVGGCYNLGNSTPPLSGLAYHVIADSWIVSCGYWGSPFLVGGCLALRRKPVEQLSPLFDESLTFGSAEVSLNEKLKSLNLKRKYIEALAITHNSSISWKELMTKASRQGYGQALIAEQMPEPKRGSEQNSLSLFSIGMSHPLIRKLKTMEKIRAGVAFALYSLTYDWGRAKFKRPERRQAIFLFLRMAVRRLRPVWHRMDSIRGELRSCR